MHVSKDHSDQFLVGVLMITNTKNTCLGAFSLFATGISKKKIKYSNISLFLFILLR